MDFLFVKTAALAAASSAVRLPQPATTTLAARPASSIANHRRPTSPVPPDKRGRQRAERARYHAQCRMVAGF